MAIAIAGAAADATQQGLFNLKGLWDTLPLGLFLQACGSAASREAVSALKPDTDKAMGKLPANLPEFVRASDDEPLLLRTSSGGRRRCETYH